MSAVAGTGPRLGDFPTAAARQAAISTWIAELHDDLTGFFEGLDGAARFREDPWDRDGGGGGLSRVLTDGALFEKAGVNRSVVHGILPESAAARLGARHDGPGTLAFFASGVSLVVHPRSPMVPTLHENVRWFELSDLDGNVVDAWFGGGIDLTPYQPFPEDARDFHRALGALCDAHGPGLYPAYKAWCDRYFVNTHRGHEARGVGGVFFDHLRPGDADPGLAFEALWAFVRDVGRAPHACYAPIVARRRDLPYGERERRFQLFRRGRYVEFNLLHDRGTLFGLQTSARIESVLMSLPPLAAWEYAPQFEDGSPEARLQQMLRPRDWRGDADGA